LPFAVRWRWVLREPSVSLSPLRALPNAVTMWIARSTARPLY
jgi:hypothetical protein